MSQLSEMNALFCRQMQVILGGIGNPEFRNVFSSDLLTSVVFTLKSINSTKQPVIVRLSEGKWFVHQGNEPVRTYSHFDVISKNEFIELIKRRLN